jgi:hypothetical protein
MAFSKNNIHKIILWAIGIILLVTGIVLFFIPPALFPDPSDGFQVLQSMLKGGGFNNLVSPDQGDISQNYTQFLTWWSPGQYLVPYFFKLITGLNIGQGIAITVTIAGFCGLAGFYCFFKKIGFTPTIAAISLAFIICQEAFMIPYVYYNGGEILIFSFEGWFLYGCIALKKSDLKLVLFVLLSALAGFFLKSSFIWIYGAGLCCLWVRLSANRRGIADWIKNALFIGIPAVISFATIYVFYISKGESPVTHSSGFKLMAETFSFPLASPILSGFSIDDLFNGLIENGGDPVYHSEWRIIVLILIALLSVALILSILRYVLNNNYRLFLVVFYSAAILFFGFSYLRQLEISMDARHFRMIGLLIVPGVIYLVARFKPVYKFLFILVAAGIACHSFSYLINGFKVNKLYAKGKTGVAQPNIDQASLNQVLKLDQENRNITFVFIGDDIGLELLHNRYIALQPISDNLKINTEDYQYDGFAGPLYIVLPESYNGPKEKLVMKSFPGYTGFNESMLSDKYVLYVAKMKRQAPPNPPR